MPDDTITTDRTGYEMLVADRDKYKERCHALEAAGKRAQHLLAERDHVDSEVWSVLEAALYPTSNQDSRPEGT